MLYYLWKRNTGCSAQQQTIVLRGNDGHQRQWRATRKEPGSSKSSGSWPLLVAEITDNTVAVLEKLSHCSVDEAIGLACWLGIALCPFKVQQHTWLISEHPGIVARRGQTNIPRAT